MVAVGLSDAAGVAVLVASAGYGEEEPVAVGVSGLAGGSLVVAQGRTRGGPRFAADTLTYAASLSKEITAACVALLVDDGLVAVDEPLSRWLPGCLPGRARCGFAT
jgi:CubicO group peptidase (beta-lactamase class C family)